MENRKKMLAVMFVTAMYIASVSAVCLTDTQTETSAAVGTKGFYTYKIALNATTGAVTVTNESGPDAVTPASVGSSGAGTSAWQTSGGENMGAWKFDSKTGIGPFNSFYAAFDTTNGNKLLGKLDPNDLTKYLAGGDVKADANIMWILPTVYWKTDAEGSLILTNDPAAGGTAYAHTVNGVTYQYLAIGVYEASGDTTSGMYSKTGSTPVSNEITTYKWMMNGQTVATDDGENSNGRAMLWNFYQYSLYKYCVTTVIGGFGFGNVGFGPTGGIQQTGATASLGPYGNIGSENGEGVYASDGFKIFLENVWGGGNDAIADIYVDGGGRVLISSDPDTLYWYDNKTMPGTATGIATNNNLPTANITDTGLKFPVDGTSKWGANDGYISSISQEASTWGLPITKFDSADKGWGYAHSSASYNDAITAAALQGDGKITATAKVWDIEKGETYYQYVSQMNMYKNKGLGANANANQTVNSCAIFYWKGYVGDEQVGRLAFVYSEKVEEVSQTEAVGDDSKTWTIAEDAIGGTCMYLPEPRNGVAGYTFSGWYSKDSYENEYKVGEPGDPWILSSDNAKLYGKWEKALPAAKEFRVTLKKTEDSQDKITVHLEAPDGWGGLEAGKVTIGGTYYRNLDGEAVRSYGQILGVESKALDVQSLAWISSQDLEFTLPDGWKAYLIYAEYEVTDENAAHYKETVRTAYVLADDATLVGT